MFIASREAKCVIDESVRGNDVYIIRPDQVEMLMLSLNTDKSVSASLFLICETKPFKFIKTP